jgi:PAS domain S-box-containing protein
MKKDLKILYVEDSERDAALLTRHLTREGYELSATRVDTADAVRAALENESWDVILCDYSMPELTALQTLAIVKEMHLDVPFIIISGTIGEETAVEAMIAGAHDYLMKDKLARLGHAIERELQEAENRRTCQLTEASLRQSEARYRRLLETTYEGIWITNADAKIAYVNQRMAEMIGLEPHEMVGKVSWDFLAESSRVEIDDRWKRRNSGAKDQYDLCLRHRDGSDVWTIVCANPVLDDQGNFAGSLCMLTDITERKRVEQEFKKSEERFRRYFDLGLIGMCISSPDKGLLDVNPQLCHMLGYDREELLRMSWPEMTYPPDLVADLAQFDRVMAGEIEGYSVDKRWIRKDGEIIYSTISVKCLRQEDGAVDYFIVLVQDITRRKLAEVEETRLNAEIAGQRLRLNNIVANVPGVVWESLGPPEASSRDFEFVSEHVLPMTGYSVEEWLATPNFWLTIVHPDDRVEVARRATVAFSRGGTNKQDFRWIRKDGSVIWVESISSIVTDVAGRPIGVRGVSLDITERKHAEHELKRSEERYRDLIENAHDIIYTHDLAGNYTSVNQAGEQISGYSREESLRMSLTDTVAPEYLATALEMTQRKLAGESVTAYELEILAKDGHRIPLEVNTRTIFENGEPVGIQGIARDITERKRAESARREAELKYLGLFENALDGVFQATPDGKFFAANPALARMLGYSSPAELVAARTDIANQHYVDTEDYLEFKRELAEKRQVLGHEFQVYRKDGTVIWTSENTRAVTDDEGQVQYFEGFVRDISDRKQAENDIRSGRSLIMAGLASLLIMVALELLEHPAETFLSHTGVAMLHVIIASLIIVSVSYILLKRQVRLFRLMLEQTTERKRAEESKRESEEKYRLLFERNPLPMWVFDTATLAFIAVNEAAIRHYGYSREEFLAKTIGEIRPPDEFARLMREVERSQGAELNIAGNWRHMRKDGTIIDVEITSHGLEFAGRPAKLVLANDVTESKRIAAIQARRTALRELRADINLALGNRDLSDEETFQHCTDAMVEHLDASFARIWTLKAEANVLELRAGSGLYTELDGPLSRVPVGAGNIGMIAQEGKAYFTNDVAHDGRIGDREWAIANRIVSFAGFPLMVEERIAGVLGLYSVHPLADDEVDALSVKASTISQNMERKRGEQALRNSEEQLRQSQKMEAVGQLAGGIAHDFNNLLTTITGYSELALRKLQAEDPLRSSLEEIKRAGYRAAGLTGQLLAFSRKQVLQPEVLSLNSIILELEKMLGRLIGEDIELRTFLAPELCNIKADPGQVEQIIVNLAVNARDAMPQGGKLTIETRNVHLDEHYAREHDAVTPGPFVQLTVTDTGAGMDEEMQQRIFEPFFTTKPVGKGTGLGLSTAYGIVKQSQGNILVYSEVGHGTTFKIYFPQIGESVAESRRALTEEANLHGSETVLLIEDDDTLRQLAVEVLRMFGYQVLEAANGGAALLICERYSEVIDLLLTDVIMPEMSGHEAALRLGKIRPQMKILYMSGYTDSAIVHHGVLDEGANFIQKPFSPDDLGRKLREVLQQS